ncbi:MAG: peptidylprolyl isomerase [Paenibacillaceae bacterium]
MLPNNKRFSYKLLMLGLAILLIMVLSACGGKNDAENAGKDAGKDSGKIIATYEGGTVTVSDFNKYIGARKLLDQNYAYLEMMPDFQTMVLNQYIAESVLSKDVSEEVEKQSKEQAKAASDNMKTSLEANAEQKTQIDTFMKDNGIDFDDLENYVYKQYKLQSVLGAKYSDAEIKQKYDDNIKADKNAYMKATVRHVLVALKDQEGKDIRTKEEALARANEAYEKLKSTGDWDKLALEYSDDRNKDTGGIYKDADVSQWVENFKNAALNQPLNEIGKPIETEYGYHVVVVEARTNEYEVVKNTVKSEMINEYFLNYIEKEVPKLIIGEVNLPKADTPVTPEVPSGTLDGADTKTEKAK